MEFLWSDKANRAAEERGALTGGLSVLKPGTGPADLPSLLTPSQTFLKQTNKHYLFSSSFFFFVASSSFKVTSIIRSQQVNNPNYYDMLSQTFLDHTLFHLLENNKYNICQNFN